MECIRRIADKTPLINPRVVSRDFLGVQGGVGVVGGMWEAKRGGERKL